MPELEEVLPKYLQVANHYRDLIVSGSLPAGAELPSERQIAAEWDVSRPTATRALAALRNLGLAEARQGAGTFVRGQVRLNRGARDRYLRARDAGRIYGPGERAEIVDAKPDRSAGVDRRRIWATRRRTRRPAGPRHLHR